ncbi:MULTISPECIES: hypothetical protein [Microbacterium]|jgi:hypothetical protein|uniref:hypothetical protein n=1 Tax=Microbacterium TaxID=33882 RepID=UPI001E4C9616|nr:hypothetical protein [Microbacterium nymphoidis]MCD2499201.1 hypothetical protein [Microbacterium nymphoidis]
MSASSALPEEPHIQPRPGRGTGSPRRHLRPVDAPARRRRPQTVYGLTAIIGVVLIVAAQLFFSIASTQTTHHIVDLTEQQRSLTVEAQALFDQVAGLSSPQYLAANATSAGMISAGSPIFLRLSDAAVLGTASAETASTIDAKGRAAVGNDLIKDTPLVMDPSATLTGKTAPVTAPEASTEGAGGAAADTTSTESVAAETELPQQPPAISEGLPTPETH